MRKRLVPARIPAPDSGPHSFLVSFATKVFEDLDVAAAVLQSGRWGVIHERSSLLEFEFEHGVEMDRFAYNQRCFARMRRERAPVLGTHAGFCDLFVPILLRGGEAAALVAGPFATGRPTSTDLLERWRRLSGRQGLVGDPEFARYIAASLSTLVLSGEALAMFREMLERLADQMASRGSATETHARIQALREALAVTRLADRIWRTTRAMVDERTSRTWSSPARARELAELGLARFPDRVAVGLLADRDRRSDPVEALLRRHAFQRATVELSRAAGHAVAGRVGDHGVVFLSAARGRRDLRGLVEKASSLGQRSFGLTMHAGLAVSSGPLPAQYQAALAAAESALSRGVDTAEATADGPASSALAELRRELGRMAESDPSGLAARFDRFVEVVAIRCGHRLEPMRAHLEAGFGRIVEGLSQSGTMERKAENTLVRRLERDALEVSTVSDLLALYRRAVEDVADAESRPVAARHERSLRRAEEYMREHYAEPLSLARVAQEAGFAPNYFSALFHAEQRTTFAGYLQKLRIERAKQLLSGTPLTLQRIAQLCGLSTRHYLGRVFKRAADMTPVAYRRQALLRARD
jgi:AraC-like DNA-binding protein